MGTVTPIRPLPPEPVDLDDVRLGPVGRVVTGSAAAADVALRTAAASVVAATVAPFAALGDLAREQAHLEVHAALAEAGDASRTFVAPDGPPPGVVTTRQSPLASGRLRGRVDLLSFPSRHVPHVPALRDTWRDQRRNGTVWAQHWRHGDRPRPTLLVSHGFMASPYLVNSAFFSLPWFHSHGYDVVLVTLPFHGRRREQRLAYSGAGLFADGVAHLGETMFQAVHDVRSLVEHLLATGVPRVGMTGVSLGGYVTAMLAAAEDRLAFAVPNCPVVDLHETLGLWQPAGAVVSAGLARGGADPELVRLGMAAHSPLTYPVRLERERLFLVHGLGDRLAPPQQGRALWEHWGRPRVHWFPGNHTLHVARGEYLRRMGRFFNQLGFGAP